jgi:uncharacterized lipoprotein YajG
MKKLFFIVFVALLAGCGTTTSEIGTVNLIV